MKARDLEAEIDPLLRELRGAPSADYAALGRMRERLAVSLMTAAMLVPDQATAAAFPAVERSASWLGGKTGLVAALTLGAGVGATGLWLLRTPPERVEYRERVVERRIVPNAPSVVAPVPTAVLPAPRVRPALVPQPSLPSSVEELEKKASPSAVVSSTRPDLAAELRLLDRARKALTEATPEAALSTLAQHAQRYPSGVLSQEREALRVKALLAAGRAAEARAAGQRFIARYPRSSLTDAVKSSIETIP